LGVEIAIFPLHEPSSPSDHEPGSLTRLEIKDRDEVCPRVAKLLTQGYVKLRVASFLKPKMAFSIDISSKQHYKMHDSHSEATLLLSRGIESGQARDRLSLEIKRS
jgi:hypothetical protein